MSQANTKEFALDNPAFVKSPGDESSNGVHVDKKVVKPPETNTRFGYGPFRPRWLQAFNKIWVFVIFLALYCLVHGFVINGITGTSITAIERHFRLPSSKSGLIPSAEDIGAISVMLFVTYIAGRYNKVTWIASGACIMAVGSFLFLVPHLAADYDYGAASGKRGITDTCQGEGPQEDMTSCESGSGSLKWLGVFMVAMIIHGIGFSPMFPLGAVYLHDNAEPATATMYLGILYAGVAIGTALGFLAGGQFLQKYFVDFDRVDQDSLGFGANDPRWVGAWWLGYAISCVGFFLVSLPLFGFPKYLPSCRTLGQSETDKEKTSDINKEHKSYKDKEQKPENDSGSKLKENILGFFKAFVRLARNPIYVCVTISACTASLRMFGLLPFLFKYLTEMYNLDFAKSGGLIAGIVVCGAVGSFLGGALVRIFKLNIVGMLRLSAIVSMLGCLLSFGFLLNCPDVKLAGLEVSYPNERDVTNRYIATCNMDCNCDEMSFSPVCGDDGIVYYSGCHAGCLAPPDNAQEPYSNCSCIASSFNRTMLDDVTASKGRCDDGCSNMKLFMPFMFLQAISSTAALTPGSMVAIRCVDDDLRPFALGVTMVLVRLLGQIPGPVLFGAILDSTCVIWTGGRCDSSSVCGMYDKSQMSLGAVLFLTILFFIPAAFFIIGSIFASRKAARENSYSPEIEDIQVVSFEDRQGMRAGAF